MTRAVPIPNDISPAIAPALDGSTFGTVAKRLARLPIWIFHGDVDTVVPVAESRGMAEALQKVNGNVQHTELAVAGHNAWDPAYDRADVFQWLFRHRRP